MDRLFRALVLLALSAGCGRESAAPTARAGSPLPAERATPAAPKPAPRERDPRLVQAERELERGELDAAERQRIALRVAAGLDGELLGARILAARGDDVATVRAIEALRAAHPEDARVPATAAEIHAAAGRLESARAELGSAYGLAPRSGEVLRARGVLALVQPGGARKGLEHLLEARELDPSLGYLDRALVQAHVLVASQDMAQKEFPRSAEHARAALALDPDNGEAKLALADSLAALGDFEAALVLFEELRASGRDLGAQLPDLYRTAAFAALLAKDRALAVKHYARARELGASDEELQFGATVLAEECSLRIEAGANALKAGELERAETEFRAALEADPRSLAAENHLGVVLFERGDFSGAAQCWRAVLARARGAAEPIELPDPVELNLARALYRAGALDELAVLIESELARQPPEERAAELREMQRRLAAGR